MVRLHGQPIAEQVGVGVGVRERGTRAACTGGGYASRQ
jgi:hypothetical protein